MMLRLVFCLVFVIITSCESIKNFSIKDDSRKDEFVLNMNDIPLYKGLKLLKNQSFAYDSGFGSVVTSVYEYKYDNFDENGDKVAKFYKTSLENLGWKENYEVGNSSIKRLSFVRDHAKLYIELKEGDEKAIISFSTSRNIN